MIRRCFAAGAALLLGMTMPLAAAPASAGTAPTSPTPAPSPSATPTATITLAAVGDMIFGNTPDLPSDPGHYLDPVDGALTSGSQIVFANLEGTLTTETKAKCKPHDNKCFSFRNPPRYARILAAAGFTVLNDANNHSDDFGKAGQEQTVRSIHAAGMAQTGLPGEITIVHAAGHKVAMVAFAPYSYDADLLDLPDAAALIRKAHSEARVVIVYMHAGAEGADKTHVTGHEEYAFGEDRGNPERFAHMAIRNGASLVIASGPHVLRGMEFFRGRLIAYSLGNFANYHNFGGGGILSESAILHVTLSPAGRFVTGRLTSVALDSEGRASLGGGSIATVRRLSREDFAAHAARLGRRGLIRPPA
jgi:hypothetical protein